MVVRTSIAGDKTKRQIVQPEKLAIAFPLNSDINYNEILTNNINKQRKSIIPEQKIDEEII